MAKLYGDRGREHWHSDPGLMPKKTIRLREEQQDYRDFLDTVSYPYMRDKIYDRKPVKPLRGV